MPSKELAGVRLLWKCENQTPATLLCWGSLELAVSQGDFLLIIGLAALGESSLKSSLKSKEQWPDGQMHCPGRPAAKTNSAQPCQGLPFSPGELWWDRGSQPRLPSHRALHCFLPFLTSGFLNPWKAEKFFQPQESTCQCTGGRNINALPDPSVGQTGLGTKWKDELENTSRNFPVHTSQETSSLE